MHVADMKARFRTAPDQIMISVHRGRWNPLPENSLAGIREASAWDVVEIDLRLDADGRPYVMHDGTLLRTTGSEAASSGASVALLRSLRLKGGAGGVGAETTDEPVPFIEDALEALGDGAIFDLDVKRDEDVEAVATYLAKLGQQGRGTLKIDVMGEEDLLRLKALEEAHDVMIMAKLPLRSDEDLAVVEMLRSADVAAVEVSFDSFDLLGQACTIAGDGLRVGVFTLDGIHCCGMCDAAALKDPGAVWGRLVDLGVGLIMTDRPREVTSYLASR